MKKTVYSILLAAFAILAASCSKDFESNGLKGEGSLSLGVSFPGTKAAMSQEELASDARVNIYLADFSGMVRTYKYSEAPENIYLPVNAYRVDVVAGEAAKENPSAASWEQKSYKGSKQFTITAGENTSVHVEAGVNNAVTKVSFDKTVSDCFSAGYTFTIGLDPENQATQLVYDASKAGNDGYFLIDGLDDPSFLWIFTGKFSKDGSEFTKSGRIENIEPGKAYTMNLVYTITNGDLEFTLSVDTSTDNIDDIIVFDPVSSGVSALNRHEIWAYHATVHAYVDESEFSDPSVVKFAYSADGANWAAVDAVRDEESAYSAVLTGLEGGTDYTCKLVIAGEDQGDPVTFTTEDARNVPNHSFEHISKVGSESFYKWYNPSSSDEDARTAFWGSGNGDETYKGSGNGTVVSVVITVPDESDKVDGERSVCAKSKSVMKMLAAGNIFTGHFKELVGTSGGKVCFGRPWTSRPKAISFYVKYTTGKIDVIKNLPEGVKLTNNDYDRANIKIALGTWDHRKYGGDADSPVLVNTTDASTFRDYNTDKSTIANAELILYGEGYQQINGGEKVAATVSEWRQVTVPLDYHTLTEIPTHIIISCASSMYGDYFTGSSSSTFWIDDVHLIYE